MRTGDNISKDRADWDFGGNVPDNFVEHVRRSVPFYDEGHELVCLLSDFFCHRDSVCYELGVSTGELIRKLALYNKHKPTITWVGIDNEDGMVEKAKAHCADIPNIAIHKGDIISFDYQKTDLIVAYYTVQFVPERHRQELFDLIYEKLNWGGAFILFEKVRAPDARFQDMMTALYNDFKIKNKFSADEIVNKSQSLKGVLDPFSTEGNLGLLRRAGFVDIMTVMKYVCFEGFLAVK